MTRIAIVSLTISHGDAVGNDALEMGRILTARGHTVAWFSSHWVKKGEHSRDLAELDDFLADDPEAILIYHHLVGWTAGLDQLRRAACRRISRRQSANLPVGPRTTARLGQGRLRPVSVRIAVQSGRIDRRRRPRRA